MDDFDKIIKGALALGFVISSDHNDALQYKAALQKIVDDISPKRADDLGAIRKQAKAALDDIDRCVSTQLLTCTCDQLIMFAAIVAQEAIKQAKGENDKP